MFITALSVVIASLPFLAISAIPNQRKHLEGFHFARRQGKKLTYTDELFPGKGDASLIYGNTRYYLFGPEDGHRVVLLHGISVGAPIWQRIAEYLAEQGCRVLVYDMYGRGYSDAPGTVYSDALYVTQLHSLLDFVSWNDSLYHVVGVSMGGGVATSFCSFYPRQVASLSLIAPAGLLSTLPPVVKLLRIPILGDLLITLFGRQLLLRQANNITALKVVQQSDPDTRALFDRNRQIVTENAAYCPGFVWAYARTATEGPLLGLAERYRTVGRVLKDKKVRVLWGKADVVVPWELSEKVKEYIPHAEFEFLDGIGHEILFTSMEKTREFILKTVLDSSGNKS